MKKGKVIGIVLILVGAFTIYWAQTHSPQAGVGQIIGNALSGSYTMSEGSYYFTLVIGATLGLFGLYKLIK